MNAIDFIGWSATAFVVLGSILIVIPKRLAFIAFVVSQILWIVFAFNQQHYALLFQSIFMIGINITGWYNWGKKGVGTKSKKANKGE